MLFATISGAHLYGFPSPDSDFDLRGAHVLPLENVVGLDVRDETIEDSRVIEGQAAALQIDDAFDRAWRRVGLALDRSGFTVEDRDRAQGLYFVRYVDPALAGREQPGFFSRLFSFGRKDEGSGLARYRVSVKGEGERSTVTVLNSQGVPESGEAGKRIIGLLIEDLK